MPYRTPHHPPPPHPSRAWVDAVLVVVAVLVVGAYAVVFSAPW